MICGFASKSFSECFEESIAIWRELSNRKELAKTLTNYSFLLNRQGDFSSAISAIEESIAIFRDLGNAVNLARAEINLALSFLDLGNYTKAIPLFENNLNKAIADQHMQALCLHNLGEAELQKGDLTAADKRLKECMIISEKLGHKPLAARTGIIQGEIEVKRGNSLLALEKQREALRDLKGINDKQGIIGALEAIACMHFSLGNSRLAVILYGASSKLRAVSKMPLGPARQHLIDSYLDPIKELLGAAKTKQLLLESQEYDQLCRGRLFYLRNGNKIKPPFRAVFFSEAEVCIGFSFLPHKLPIFI